MRFRTLPLRSLMSYSVRALDAPLTRDQVRVCLSSRFNRLPHPSDEVEASAAQTWLDLKQQKPQLFNATKFRHFGMHEDGNSLRLDWGITDYASYLGTCCSELLPRLLEDGETLQGDRLAFLSRKVGVAAVLETTDGQVALIKRSKSVGLYQDLMDTPGGHPEPEHVGLTQELLETLEGDKKQEMETKARDEFFQSIVNEVHEEVNLAPEQQQEPTLLGVVLQADAQTPSFSFHIKTPCTAEQVRELYSAGPPDKFESVKLEMLQAESLLDGELALDKLKLTPSAQGTLGLWKRHTLRARGLGN